jgi:chromosome segregation ATPase
MAEFKRLENAWYDASMIRDGRRLDTHVDGWKDAKNVTHEDYDNLHKELDARNAQIEELERESGDLLIQLNRLEVTSAAWEIKAGAFQKERDEALAKADAWRKARDAERETVQRLLAELTAWSTWADEQGTYVRKLGAKLCRARKTIKRLRGEL